MVDFTKHYKLDIVIGQGAFGQVVKAKHNESGDNVAIKFCKGGNSLKHEYTIFELLEIRSSELPPSPKYIPSIYGFGSVMDLPWISMELLGPSIESLWEKCENFTKETILMMGIEMLKCLDFLHARKIVHGDIKADNFAINAKNPQRIMIFDFGLARNSCETIEEFRGSLLYASIATHEYRPVHRKNDIESLGYLLADFNKPLPWKDTKWPSTSFRDKIEYGLELKKNKNIFAMSAGFFELTLYLMHVDAHEQPSNKYLRDMFR